MRNSVYCRQTLSVSMVAPLRLIAPCCYFALALPLRRDQSRLSTTCTGQVESPFYTFLRKYRPRRPESLLLLFRRQFSGPFGDRKPLLRSHWDKKTGWSRSSGTEHGLHGLRKRNDKAAELAQRPRDTTTTLIYFPSHLPNTGQL